jgi:hypothetical protein
VTVNDEPLTTDLRHSHETAPCCRTVAPVPSMTISRVNVALAIASSEPSAHTSTSAYVTLRELTFRIEDNELIEVNYEGYH